MTRGLLVTHSGERCGVWQFGARLHRALSSDGRIDWHYAECADMAEFVAAADAARPDVILANLHPFTLPWAVNGLRHGNAVTFAVFHEGSRASVAALAARPFDVLLVPDPTLLPQDPGALPVPRFIPEPVADLGPPPDIFTVGSFGFATSGKGFDRLCALVNAQFDEARIRINLPPHNDPSMVPPAATAAVVERCRAAVTKPGISLDITHDFMDDASLMRFLAGNSINAFLYDDAPGRGISSCVDYALAAGRPIAVSRTAMFRQVTGANPSICAEERSLVEIAGSGLEPLAPHRAAFSEARAGAGWNDAMLGALKARRAAAELPDGRGYNKLLDDTARAAYGHALAELARLAPEMLTRKIERANIQQGFALDAALRLAKRYDEPRILALGSYEDTAVASLVALGWRIEQADPQVNGMQLEDFYRAPGAGGQYDMILCVSVLEHVPDDETFVRQAAELLAPGGVAIFTVDYNNTFPEHGKMPQADRRLYTTHDLRHRLMGVLPDCALLDPPRWDEGVEDFDYEDCRYAFASWVWEKLPPGVAGAARSAVEALGGPPWKALLSAAVETRHAAEAELEIAEERLREARAELAALELAEWQRNDALRREMERQAAEAVATAAEAARAAQAAAAAALLAPTPRQRLRRLAIQVYSKLLRPFVRPVAWRLRGFMTGGVSNQIQALRHEVAAMRSSGVANPAMLPPGMAQGHNPLPAQDPAMIRATEDALLTIALRGGKG